MISEVRTYIKGVLFECDPRIKEHKEYFTSANIADTKLEYSYFIGIGDLADNEQPENTNQSLLPVTIEIFKNGGNDIIAKLDDAYSKTIDFKASLTDKTRVTQNSFIKKVSSSGITKESIENNDNAGKFTIQLQVTLGYNA